MSAKVGEEVAVAKVPVTVDKIKKREEGTSQPTINQAQELSKLYRGSLAFSFLQFLWTSILEEILGEVTFNH